MAVVRYNSEKLKQISHSLIGGLEIGGAVYFSETKNANKATEIKSTLTKNICEKDYAIFRYDEDSEELFLHSDSGESSIDEEELSNG